MRLIFLLVMSCSALAAETAPQRIITLSPHLAEIVALLGAGDRLLGVSDYSDYPEQVKKVPRIGGAVGLDFEAILTINPDLILAWQGGRRDSEIERLKKLNFRVVSIKSETLEDIPASIRVIGKLLNRQQQSSKLIAEFKEHQKQISDKYGNLPPRRFFIEISSQPLMVLSNHHSFGTGLGLCNMKNIFADEKMAAIVVDLESILSRDADFILLRNSVANDAQELTARTSFYQVRDDGKATFISFNEDAAFRQTPRLLDAVEEVCRAVQG